MESWPPWVPVQSSPPSEKESADAHASETEAEILKSYCQGPARTPHAIFRVVGMPGIYIYGSALNWFNELLIII